MKAASLFSVVMLGLLMVSGQPVWAQIDPGPGTCNPNEGGACAADDNLCNVEFCNPQTLKCDHRPKCPADGNQCTTETCNPNNGACSSVPAVPLPEGCGEGGGGCDPNSIDNGCPSDGNACTTEVCNPESRQCEPRPVVCASDNNNCTSETCSPESGCHSVPAEPLPAGCGEGGGGCDPNGIDPCPGDGNACTTEVCNPESRRCEPRPVVCASDDNNCTSEICSPESGCHSVPAEPLPEGCGEGGGCDPNSIDNGCPDDDNPCTTQVCNPESRECEPRPVVCEQNDNRCTVEACNPETGDCESGEPRECDENEDNCTTEACDPETGQCSSTPTNPAPDGCEGAICRTPGFWGTHAADIVKKRAVNITQAVIDEAGGVLSICGKSISTTITSDDNSAVEALCVSPSGDIRLQLARQLTAAALNCVMSGGGSDCMGTSIYSTVFSNCNAVCGNSASSTSSITSCIGQIDCLNNGGTLLANGFCQTGKCADGTACKEGGAACLDGSACRALDNNCHTAPLVNADLGLDFDPPGPAGSSSQCNTANKSTCSVIGGGLTSCTK